MDVRWRLFARDVLSLRADGSNAEGLLCFGRPPRPVRGLRLLGVVVGRSRATAAPAAPAVVAEEGSGTSIGTGKAPRATGCDGGDSSGGGGGGGGSGGGHDGAMAEGEFGLLGIDDGTGVVDVRLPLRLWSAVALWDQVDIVGTPEISVSSTSSSSSIPRPGVGIKADGCYVENDPNVATLRALECINLYKACYFSGAWSPSASPLPPLLPDPQRSGGQSGGGGFGGGAAGATAAVVHGVDDGAAAPQFHGPIGEGDGGSGGGGGGSGVGGGAGQTPSLEDLLGLIGSMGGATGDELVAKLGLLPDHAGVASALDQMQLDGAIYLAGDRYMPL